MLFTCIQQQFSLNNNYTCLLLDFRVKNIFKFNNQREREKERVNEKVGIHRLTIITYTLYLQNLNEMLKKLINTREKKKRGTRFFLNKNNDFN